jgi:hypothetical protein
VDAGPGIALPRGPVSALISARGARSLVQIHYGPHVPKTCQDPASTTATAAGPWTPRGPGRRSCAQGRWPVARASATGWTDHDRGPQADAEERITSAHRAIEIREKRRRVLSSRPAGITLALQRTSSASAAATHPIGQRTRRRPRSARHRWSRARRITTYRTADIACQAVRSADYSA